jgi:branched-chain amino acid transport system substrate-binding protein
MSVFSKAGSGLAILAASALVLAGCAAAEEDTSAPAAAPAPDAAAEICGTDLVAGFPAVDPIAPPAALDREVTLKLGSILPVTGNLAFLGPPEIAGVDLAVAEINASASGVLGGNVEILHRDSGDTTTDIATQSATELINAGVSGVIGAASSSVSFTFIDQLAAAGVIHFSPANTSPRFTDYDDGGYYFRTAPSDVLQGRILGNLITQDGNQRIGVLYLNDDYGIGLFENAKIAIEAAGSEVVAAEPYSAGDNVLSAQIDAILAQSPDAIIVLAFDEIKVAVPELVNTKGFDGGKIYLVDGNLANYEADFEPGTLNCAKGTLPGVLPTDEDRAALFGINPDLTEFAYANESYDATIIMALAAVQAGSVRGSDIRDNIASVTRDGTKCTSFQECVTLIEAGEDIDFDGRSGPITMSDKGDPTEAYIGIYQYGSDNNFAPVEVVYGKLE